MSSIEYGHVYGRIKINNFAGVERDRRASDIQVILGSV